MMKSTAKKGALPLPLWERVGVRGYGLSIEKNPSPGSHLAMRSGFSHKGTHKGRGEPSVPVRRFNQRSCGANGEDLTSLLTCRQSLVRTSNPSLNRTSEPPHWVFCAVFTDFEPSLEP